MWKSVTIFVALLASLEVLALPVRQEQPLALVKAGLPEERANMQLYDTVAADPAGLHPRYNLKRAKGPSNLGKVKAKFVGATYAGDHPGWKEYLKKNPGIDPNTRLKGGLLSNVNLKAKLDDSTPFLKAKQALAWTGVGVGAAGVVAVGVGVPVAVKEGIISVPSHP